MTFAPGLLWQLALFVCPLDEGCSSGSAREDQDVAAAGCSSCRPVWHVSAVAVCRTGMGRLLSQQLFSPSFFVTDARVKRWIQGILKGEVSLYHWPPVWLVRNQLYDNYQFLFLFAKQTNPNQSYRRSMVEWYFPFKYSLPQQTGQNLGRVFNTGSGCMKIDLHLLRGIAIQPNLELKTRPK